MSRWLWFVLFAFSALLLSGCGGGGGTAQPDPTVRVLNASPDSTSLEFLLNDNVVGNPLAFLASSPNFAPIRPEVLDVRIREAGTTPELWAEAINFVADRHYLLAAVGLETFGTEVEKRLRLVSVNINRTAPNGNKARLYVIHGYSRQTGFQTPPIDFQTPGDNPQFKLEEIEFGNTKNFEVDSGSITFEARRAGTQNILFSAPFTLGAGKIYAALFVGIEGGSGAQAPQIVMIELQPE